MSDRTAVLFVCLGNICRSPMAEGVLQHLVERRGIGDRYRVESAGTAAYHVGEPPDPRTLDVLRRNGIALRSYARQVRDSDFDEFDWILAMDQSNFRTLMRRCPDHRVGRVHKTLELMGGGDVSDPYYGGPDGFDTNYAELVEALEAWLDRWESP